MTYEITIRQLEEYTEEEIKNIDRANKYPFDEPDRRRYSDKPFHEVRVLQAEVSKEEFEAVKKAIIGVL